MRSCLRAVTPLVASFAMTACTVFPTPEAPRVMDLGSVDPVQRLETRHSRTLRVDTPLASEPVNGTRILAKPTPHEFRMYGNARWRDIAPVLVRDHLIDTLRQSQGFANVVTDTSAASTDLTLISELSAFQAETIQGKTQIVIELHAEVLDNRSRKSLCVRNSRLEEPAASSELNDVVEAFGNTAHQLAEETLLWVHRCLEEN
ncbi:ABC-type transport auxiliary lipoprotein family protein [Marinobacter sp. DUT-1]|uniref:ABC-type transport auxiliary lipoprotein family protein n=1 Tax=Marinobacter sp. DUT-1 TaxID=3412037 RepID=UPI003D16CB3A